MSGDPEKDSPMENEAQSVVEPPAQPQPQVRDLRDLMEELNNHLDGIRNIAKIFRNTIIHHEQRAAQVTGEGPNVKPFPQAKGAPVPRKGGRG